MDRYFESARIGSLLAKFALQTISMEESKELADRLAKNNIDPEQIIRSVGKMETTAGEEEALARVLASVKSEIDRQSAGTPIQTTVQMAADASRPAAALTPNRTLFRRLLPYAAAAILVLAVSLFFMDTSWLLHDNKSQLANIEPIKRYENETVLIYPSGEQIVLGTQSNIIAAGNTNTGNTTGNTTGTGAGNTIGNTTVRAGNGFADRTAAGTADRTGAAGRVPAGASATSRILGKQTSKTAAVEAPLLTIRVSKGATHTVTLEDGTKVVLYPESELRFPQHFSKSGRQVALSGEAFFDVTKDPSRPFSVKTREASVTVLGTSFNIRAYENEATNETVLVTGKVLLNSTELFPNQMAVVDKSNGHINIEAIDASAYRDRASGLFVFENRSLAEIMREFGLWYGFEYSFESELLQSKKFRLKLPRADNFNELMKLMEKTEELRFTVEDKVIKIKTTH